MDSTEFTKIAAGVLIALLAIFGSKVFMHEVFRAKQPEKPGFVVATATTGDESGKKDSAVKAVPFATLLAKADAGAGAKVAKKCAACHKFNKGGKNGQGPGLYDIVNKKIASVDGFAYSKVLRNMDGKWTFDALNGFLAAPKKWAKGTKMSFAGIKKDGQRAAVIAYLRSLSDSPVALPE